MYKLHRSKDGPYEKKAHAIVKTSEDSYDGSAATKPEIIAETISRAINSQSPKTRYAAGKLAGQLLFLRKWLSDRMFDRMILSMIK